MRAPRLDQARQVGRLTLVVHRIGRNRHPGLRAPGPDVSDRREPCGVVERPRLDDRGLRVALGIMEQARAAVGAEEAPDDAAALELAPPHTRRAVHDRKGVARHREGKGEGAAGLPLALRAMADIEAERRRLDLVAHAAALASAGQGRRILVLSIVAAGWARLARQAPSEYRPEQALRYRAIGGASNCGFRSLSSAPPAGTPVAVIAMAADLTRSTESKRHNRRDDNENYHRTTEAATDHERCGASWSRAHVCVLARRSAATAAAVDPGTARGLRAGRDAALQPVRP